MKIKPFSSFQNCKGLNFFIDGKEQKNPYKYLLCELWYSSNAIIGKQSQELVTGWLNFIENIILPNGKKNQRLRFSVVGWLVWFL